MDKITVIYEDKNFLAVNKPAGLLVHAPKAIPKQSTLVDWLLKNYPEVKNVGDSPGTRPGIVHRLDKETSGVVLVARNQKTFDSLKELFQTWQIKKSYLALVCGRVRAKSGIIKKPIYLKAGTTKRTVWGGKMEKAAITEYKVIKFLKLKIDKEEKIFSLMKVFPKTGRTHQIRIHLASIGHPVVGDSLYAGKRNNLGLKRLFLHAESLEFSQEDGKRIKIEAGLPEELKIIIDDLRFKM